MKYLLILCFYCKIIQSQEVRFNNLEHWATFDTYELYDSKLKMYKPQNTSTKWQILYDTKSKSLLIQDSIKGEMFFFTLDSQSVVKDHEIYWGNDKGELQKLDFFFESNYHVLLITNNTYTARYRRRMNEK